MGERRAWQPEEDEALKALKEQRKINKWSQISILLQAEYGVYGRNGKQCRQRYHNHLDLQICKVEWGTKEDEKLIQLHGKMGNKWARIARQLPGRTDNSVKNRFYSQFRKGMRVINDLVQPTNGRSKKPLKHKLMSKLIDVNETYLGCLPFEIHELAISLKERILKFSTSKPQQGLPQEILISMAKQASRMSQEFESSYKRWKSSKSKKSSNASLFENYNGQVQENTKDKISSDRNQEKSSSNAEDQDDMLSLRGIEWDYGQNLEKRDQEQSMYLFQDFQDESVNKYFDEVFGM